ncbi:MAG TPA: MBL fold hydrolase, partial [Ruminococcaceae bacterium]|nr:MBL fold hydrolase [Oscillospiraceae bacterium]
SKNGALDVQMRDMVFADRGEVASLLNSADALLVGSCTINRDAPGVVWDILSRADAINTHGKAAGAFGSYGWSGEAVPMLRDRLTHLKYNFVGDGVRVVFQPTENDLAAMRLYAAQVAAKA